MLWTRWGQIIARIGASLHTRLRNNERRPRRGQLARIFIAEHPDLAEAIAKSDALSRSTGASLFDYVTLYRAVHKLQARTVLECGTGKTTYALAAAMKALGTEKVYSPCTRLT